MLVLVLRECASVVRKKPGCCMRCVPAGVESDTQQDRLAQGRFLYYSSPHGLPCAALARPRSTSLALARCVAAFRCSSSTLRPTTLPRTTPLPSAAPGAACSPSGCEASASLVLLMYIPPASLTGREVDSSCTEGIDNNVYLVCLRACGCEHMKLK